MLTDSIWRAENTKGDGWKAFYNWKSEGLREVKKLLEDQITLVRDTRNEKRYHCSTCGVQHSIYRIYFSTMHVSILRKVYAYCVENKTNVIEKKEIPGLTHTDMNGKLVKPQCFAHILAKWMYPSFRLLKDNLQLVCSIDCHSRCDEMHLDLWVRRELEEKFNKILISKNI